jgi:thymidylate synthase
MTIKDITSQEVEDPDIIYARTFEFWHEKRAARVGRKSVAWFRRIHKYRPPKIDDVINDRMDPVWETEYAYYKWNVGVILCVYCGKRLTKRTVTRDHVVPQCRGGGHEQTNVEPCCANCNHVKDDMSLLMFLYQRNNTSILKAV